MLALRHPAAFALFALLALAGPAGAAPGNTEPPIAVAVIATLTGPQALAGRDAADGFQLGLKQVGQRFANQEVRVTVVDDKGSPDVARQAVRRLLERDRLTVALTALSSGSLAAVLPTLTEARVFVLNLAPAPAHLAGVGCSPWVFGLAGQADGVHEAAGVQMNQDKAKRVVVVGADAPGTAEAVAALKRGFSGEVADVLTPRHGATNFGPELARIRELRPDAVYDLLGGGMGVEFVRAWDAAGLRGAIPLYAPWSGFERYALSAMGEAALEVNTLGNWSADLDNPQNHRLAAEFEAEYGRPVTTWAAQGADAAALLDAAFKVTQGRAADSDALRGAIRHAEVASVRGPWRFNTNHVPVMTYYERHVVRDPKGRLTNELRGPALKDWRDRQAATCPMRWEEAPPPPKTAATPAAAPAAIAKPAKPAPGH
jgi:branched-chain amino acid transport system substrate-binding protein